LYPLGTFLAGSRLLLLLLLLPLQLQLDPFSELDPNFNFLFKERRLAYLGCSQVYQALRITLINPIIISEEMENACTTLALRTTRIEQTETNTGVRKGYAAIQIQPRQQFQMETKNFMQKK
jgi:hypothetical protein